MQTKFTTASPLHHLAENVWIIWQAHRAYHLYKHKGTKDTGTNIAN